MLGRTDLTAGYCPSFEGLKTIPLWVGTGLEKSLGLSSAARQVSVTSLWNPESLGLRARFNLFGLFTWCSHSLSALETLLTSSELPISSSKFCSSIKESPSLICLPRSVRLKSAKSGISMVGIVGGRFSCWRKTVVAVWGCEEGMWPPGIPPLLQGTAGCGAIDTRFLPLPDWPSNEDDWSVIRNCSGFCRGFLLSLLNL